MSSKSPYIGSTLSLMTKTDLRYEGVLYNIDKQNSTIALAKVRSFGTEDRLAAVRVAGQDEIFEFIVFKVSDVKELIVSKTPEKSPVLQNGLPEDPAIISYSKGESAEKKTSPKSQLLAALHSSSPTTTYSRVGTPLSTIKGRLSRIQAIGMRTSQLISHSDPGLRFARGESALSDRDPIYASGFSSNGRPVSNPTVVLSARFQTDYDFEAANREFVRCGSPSESAAAIATKEQLKSMVRSVLGKNEEVLDRQDGCKAGDSKESFYNKKTSFFDSISSGSKRDQDGPEAGPKKDKGISGFNRYSLDSRPLPNYFGLPEYEQSYRQQLQRYGNNSPMSGGAGHMPRF